MKTKDLSCIDKLTPIYGSRDSVILGCCELMVEDLERQIKRLKAEKQEIHQLIGKAVTRPWWSGVAREIAERLTR